MTMSQRGHFPWTPVIRFGLGHLRLPPHVFWALSLPELIALTGSADAPEHATRERLAALMALFPDDTVPNS